MSADKATIDRWLDRYFEAEATLEEEKGLRTYFQAGGVHPDHRPYAPLFDWADRQSAHSLSPDFEARVMDRLERQSSPIRPLRWRRVMAVAAGIALVVMAAWWVSRQTPDHGRAHLALDEDTFRDPEEAYAEFTAALAMVAGALDQGQQITMESVAPAEGLNILITQ